MNRPFSPFSRRARMILPGTIVGGRPQDTARTNPGRGL